MNGYDSYKFFDAIITEQQNNALLLLDKNNMLETEEKRLFYFRLILTRPNDADEVLITLRQQRIDLTDDEITTYFQTHTSIDISLLKISGRLGPLGAVLDKFKGNEHGDTIKKAFIRLLSEPSPCCKRIFYHSGYANLYFANYLNLLENHPESANDTVTVLMTLEGQRILSEGRSPNYWNAILKANWHYSKGLSEATKALAQCGLLHQKNSANFEILCQFPEFSQSIADEINQQLKETGDFTQKDFQKILNNKRKEVFVRGFHQRIGADSALPNTLSKNSIYDAKAVALMLSFIDEKEIKIGMGRRPETPPISQLLTTALHDKVHPTNQPKQGEDKAKLSTYEAEPPTSNFFTAKNL